MTESDPNAKRNSAGFAGSVVGKSARLYRCLRSLRNSQTKSATFKAMQNRLGRIKKRKKVPRPPPKTFNTRILIGLLTGSRNEAVSAMNVQANRKGKGDKRRRVTRT